MDGKEVHEKRVNQYKYNCENRQNIWESNCKEGLIVPVLVQLKQEKMWLKIDKDEGN